MSAQIGDKALRARVRGLIEEAFGRALFQNLARVHKPDGIGNFTGKIHLVGHAPEERINPSRGTHVMARQTVLFLP